MLQSKKLNSFFNECFGLNIQTTLDQNLLKYYYSLYGESDTYKDFEKYVLETYGKSGGGVFIAKDKMIFSALKSIMIKPMYYMFTKLNMAGFNVAPHQLLFGLIEHRMFTQFTELIFETYGEMSLFKNSELLKFIEEKETIDSFVGKPVNKKMRDINVFIEGILSLRSG